MCDVIITNSELEEARREGFMFRLQASMFENKQEYVELERHHNLPGFNTFGMYIGED